MDPKLLVKVVDYILRLTVRGLSKAQKLQHVWVIQKICPDKLCSTLVQGCGQITELACPSLSVLIQEVIGSPVRGLTGGFSLSKLCIPGLVSDII